MTPTDAPTPVASYVPFERLDLPRSRQRMLLQLNQQGQELLIRLGLVSLEPSDALRRLVCIEDFVHR